MQRDDLARGISLQFKADHPEVAWPQIVGMRHRIVHEDLPRLQASLLNATEG